LIGGLLSAARVARPDPDLVTRRDELARRIESQSLVRARYE
jgi:hypothetical protein